MSYDGVLCVILELIKHLIISTCKIPIVGARDKGRFPRPCHISAGLLYTGLMSFEELRRRVLATSGKTRQDVTEDDLARAIKKLRVLGGGFAVVPVGKHRLVQSVPGELNMDHTAVLQQAEVKHESHIIDYVQLCCARLASSMHTSILP